MLTSGLLPRTGGYAQRTCFTVESDVLIAAVADRILSVRWNAHSTVRCDGCWEASLLRASAVAADLTLGQADATHVIAECADVVGVGAARVGIGRILVADAVAAWLRVAVERGAEIAILELLLYAARLILGGANGRIERLTRAVDRAEFVVLASARAAFRRWAAFVDSTVAIVVVRSVAVLGHPGIDQGIFVVAIGSEVTALAVAVSVSIDACTLQAFHRRIIEFGAPTRTLRRLEADGPVRFFAVLRNVAVDAAWIAFAGVDIVDIVHVVEVVHIVEIVPVVRADIEAPEIRVVAHRGASRANGHADSTATHQVVAAV